MSQTIGDLVEIRPLKPVEEPYSSPESAISAYHFTDITSDLMTKWIGMAGGVHAGQGKALALAGFRGAGKSHFLGTLSGLLTQPELRPKLGDTHVRTAAESLGRRKWPAAIVRRGSAADLLTELKNAMGTVLGTDAGELPSDVGTLLLRAYEQGNNEPFAIFIDTDVSRFSAVSRQDGAVLTEVAEAAKAIGIFVAVALDDDIAGADGSNVSISGKYAIDYLEQEHLFKIIDSHIFVKKRDAATNIQKIYKRIQASTARFRWSEERFRSLYPLHPIVAETAPFVRVYLRDFALLKFAAGINEKAGEVSESLIGPDAMFDAVEAGLRSNAELQPLVEAYDGIVAQTGPKQKALATRALKGLFMLSLGGRGVSLDDLSSSFLLSKGAETEELSSILNNWVESDGGLRREAPTPEKAVYRLETGTPDSLTEIEGVADVTDEQVWQLLLQHTAEKFSDVRAVDESTHSTPSTIEWLGGIRRGLVHWGGDLAEHAVQDLRTDWHLLVTQAEPPEDADLITWRVASLTDEERKSLRRLFVIDHKAEAREKLGEKLAVERHRLAISLDAIWQRVFVTDALFVQGKISIPLPSSLSDAHNLAQVLSVGLAPILNEKYPDHPQFASVLHQKESTGLISRFFTAGVADDSETQRLAQVFAVPLGLAKVVEGKVVPLQAEELANAPAVQITGAAALKDGDEKVPLDRIAQAFRASSLGLSMDAQHLVLASMVSHRLVDLVTTAGNRITYRSLDLQIIWDDIVGIAPCMSEGYSESKLNAWSRALLGDDLRVVAKDRSELVQRLELMMSAWGVEPLLFTFHSLPDDAFNSVLWKRVASLEKKFDLIRRAVADVEGGRQGLEEVLRIVIELFSDTPAKFQRFTDEVGQLRQDIEAAEKRYLVANSLHLFEPTEDEETEAHRARLIQLVRIGAADPSSQAEYLEKEWDGLRGRYSAFYARKHIVARSLLQNNELLREHETALFAAAQGNDEVVTIAAEGILRDVRRNICSRQIEGMHIDGTFCDCQTSLASLERIIELPDRLAAVLNIN